ncbi:MAG: hypothetical protein AB7U23_11570 [Dehalococcoidia bacterium]
MSLPALRPYQAEVARAILQRVLSGEGGSISVEISRQGGKNELSSRVQLTLLLARARVGGSIIKCAPTGDQSWISARRLRSKAEETGLSGGIKFSGRSAAFGRADIRFLSAVPTANVVGYTASLLLEADEAQDVDVETFDRTFRPMAASTDAPVVFYGTPWSSRSLLEQAKATNLEAQRKDGVQRHFRYPWDVVAAANPAYGRYVERERARLGETNPVFRTQYLLELAGDAGRMFDAAALAQVVGSHTRLSIPVEGERYVAGLDIAGADLEGHERPERDWTVLTIGRVVSTVGGPRVEVVEHQAWQGVPFESLIETLADRLRRVWRVRRVTVDRTGLGGPVADLLGARLGRGVLEPYTFTAESKSRLGFSLLAAVHSGRLQLYRRDGSAEYAECRRQLELAQAVYEDNRRMTYLVDPTEGHDDYLMSLSLMVWAARLDGGDRMARGRETAEAAA